MNPNQSPRLSIVLIAALSLSLTLTACHTRPHAASPSIAALPDAQQTFWSNLTSLCGQSFEGRVVEDTTNSPDFAGKRLVMHVMRCESGRILVPFHVGEDRSRTWVFTPTDSGLRLKHDHRHEDGSEDEITQYGGDTTTPGTPSLQEFHADALTATLIPAAATNIWTVEVNPGSTYVYALRREGTPRRFRVEFDLTRPIQTPPLPWGW
jgi:hypothetical protein